MFGSPVRSFLTRLKDSHLTDNLVDPFILMITDFVLQPIEAAFEIVTCLIPICLSDPIRMKKDDHLVEIDGAEKNADVSITSTYSCNLSIVRMNLHCRDCFRISQAFRPDAIERS